MDIKSRWKFSPEKEVQDMILHTQEVFREKTRSAAVIILIKAGFIRLFRKR